MLRSFGLLVILSGPALAQLPTPRPYTPTPRTPATPAPSWTRTPVPPITPTRTIAPTPTIPPPTPRPGVGPAIRAAVEFWVPWGTFNRDDAGRLYLADGRPASVTVAPSWEPPSNHALHEAASPPLCGIPGDANGDGKVDATDVFYLLNFLYSGGPAPIGG